MNDNLNNVLSTKSFADKSTSSNLDKSIKYSLSIESEAIFKNTNSFNTNRKNEIKNISDYEELKDIARKIKEDSINKLPELLSLLQQSIEKRGGKFFLAATKDVANRYVQNVCEKHNAKLIVKSKSITTEEIQLNKYLEENDLEVVETDLAEFILQVADEQPSHIVAPAIHRSRERISELFKEKFETEMPLESGEDLTKFARDYLRKKFLTADIGITGANMIAAESGTLLLVESEGNIRMVTHAPPVHIAITGMEKIVPSVNDFIPFIELLAPSATGQPLTSYTHIVTPPLDIPLFSFSDKKREIQKREFHLVIVDNGRMQMRNDPILKEALYCIRCSACLNSCANFQQLGGHAFGGETYSGGIGGSWEAGTNYLSKAKFSELCTGCSKCVPNCPVKIDIPWLNENLRNRLNKNQVNKLKSFFQKLIFPVDKTEISFSIQKKFFSNFYRNAKIAIHFSFLLKKLSDSSLFKQFMQKYLGVDKRRTIQSFINIPFEKKSIIKNNKNAEIFAAEKILFFNDSFSHYSNPHARNAAIKILHRFFPNVVVSKIFSEGRDSLSQGLLTTTKKRANDVFNYLLPFLDQGYKIVVLEPSVAALFRRDYKHFLTMKEFEYLSNRSYEIVEYISFVFDKCNIHFQDYFELQKIKEQPKIFYHGHCQQKTINAYDSTIKLLTKIGFDIVESKVECCGMAGSFGYKKQYYNVSIAVGANLSNQIQNSMNDAALTVIASGVSCSEQINHLTGIKTMHPVELIAQFILDKES